MPADIVRSDATFAKLLRFAIVGGLSTLLHAALTWCLVSLLHAAPVAATVAGYLLAIPPNFLLQRNFAFRANAAIRRQLPRFLLLHAANIACSAMVMRWALDSGWSYLVGIGLVMVAIPLLSFVIMNTWIFRKAGPDPSPRDQDPGATR